ncbi:MAG: DUF1499 domain-containing protein [Gammaproteobacteria bacterium]|nr:DUF1499 domain-containing protein [Gammaproteobacteria bacterium]
MLAPKSPNMHGAAYPKVMTLETDLTVEDAVQRAAEVMRIEGHEVVNVDVDAGIVEATATTFWFGFKDDMVVRVRPWWYGGSIVDVRSVASVGAISVRMLRLPVQFPRGVQDLNGS